MRKIILYCFVVLLLCAAPSRADIQECLAGSDCYLLYVPSDKLDSNTPIINLTETTGDFYYFWSDNGTAATQLSEATPDNVDVFQIGTTGNYKIKIPAAANIVTSGNAGKTLCLYVANHTSITTNRAACVYVKTKSDENTAARMPASGTVSTLTASGVWSDTQSSYTTAGTFGFYLDAEVSAAGGGSDPWAAALPGAYGAGTAGNIVGNRIDAAVTSRLAAGNVTVGGYAAGQAPADSVLTTPANKLTTDGAGRITVGTNADKTGYSLTQSFPANFSALAITGGGVNVSDKTGFSLSTSQEDNLVNKTWGALLPGAFPADAAGNIVGNRLDTAVSSRLASGAVTVGTNNDKTGYTLSAAGVDAVWDEAQAGHVTAGTFGYNLDVPVSTVGGGGGGVADWTATEKNQIRYRLGLDGTTAAPAATPSLGTLNANVVDKTGFSLSAAGIDAVLNDTIEGSYTARQVLCAMASILTGRVSGGGTTSIVFRDLGNTVNRVSETVDANGNRTSVTFNLTGCQ